MMKILYHFNEPNRYIYLDESFFTTQMTRLYGYGPRPERLIDFVPAKHWQRVTLVAGLCHEGVLAPFTFEGSMNTDRMVEYLCDHLGPVLRPGDMLVMDNLNVHKSPRVRAELDRLGVDRLFLPPYSPDMNPIEKVFAWLKAKVRGQGPQPVERLQKSVIRCAMKMGVRMCRRFIRNSLDICYSVL